MGLVKKRLTGSFTLEAFATVAAPFALTLLNLA